MKLAGIDRVLGLELNSLGSQQYSCRYCIVLKKSNNLIVEKKDVLTGSLNVILEELPKNIPTSVVLSGKGIIHKTQQAPVAHSKDHLFSSVFPSIEQHQFYTQFFREGEATLISIARKQGVDELINKLDGVGVRVLMLSFGAIVTSLIWTQLNSYGEEIQFDGHDFKVSPEKRFISYQFDQEKRNKFPTKIGLELIPEENLVSYAAAFQLHLHQQIEAIIANNDKIIERFSNFFAVANLKNKTAIFLSVLFGALLCSFLTFSYYNQKNAELLKKVGSKLSSIDQTDFLRKNISENELLLKKLNWANGYNHGYLINDMGHSMPRQLSLSYIGLNQFKTEEEQLLRVPIIRVNGFTDNLSAVNNWIFVLKEKKWIKGVKLLKYQEDEESGRYQFSLLINY